MGETGLLARVGPSLMSARPQALAASEGAFEGAPLPALPYLKRVPPVIATQGPERKPTG